MFLDMCPLRWCGNNIKSKDTLQHSINRQKAPSFTMGNSNSKKPNPNFVDHRTAQNSRPKLERTPQLHDKIVFVGAGPSSLHMAHLLHKRGFSNITILEKSDRYGGKTYTVPHSKHPDVQHEMGTCYLHKAYDVVRELASELGVAEEIPQEGMKLARLYSDCDPVVLEYTEGTWIEMNRWIMAATEDITLGKCGDCVPDKLQKIPILLAYLRYKKAHKKAMGEYQPDDRSNGGYPLTAVHGLPGLPPQPTKEHWKKELSMSFGDFLEKHKCQALRALFSYIITAQGYGGLEFCPTFYGLSWLTPDFIWGVLRGETKSMFVKGYGALWDKIVDQDQLKIRYGVNIKSIERSRGEMDTVVVEGTNGDGSELKESFDWLFLGAPLKHCAAYMKDLDTEEHDIFQSITNYRFRTVLYTRDPEPNRDSAHVDIVIDTLFNPKKIGVGEVMGIRDSYVVYKKKIGDSSGERREQMLYQFVGNLPEHQNITEDDLDQKMNDFFEKHNVTGVEILQNGDPNCPEGGAWEYFYQFPQEALEKGKPWQLLQRQGQNSTFYVHATTRFESILDIIMYNSSLFDNIIGPNVKGTNLKHTNSHTSSSFEDGSLSPVNHRKTHIRGA